MDALVNSFKSNYPSIIIFIVVVLGIMVLLSMIGIKLNEQVTHNVRKIITVEALTNKNGNKNGNNDDIINHHKNAFNGKGFCGGDQHPSELEEKCGKLHEENCNMTTCCGWLSTKNPITERCVAGGKHGPTFHSDSKGKALDIYGYCYKNKCHGDKYSQQSDKYSQESDK